MSLIQEIKVKQIEARKARLSAVASLLTTLIGEAEMVGKNAGREVTDAEVVATVKKFIKNVDETIKALGDQDPRTAVALAERGTLESFLPAQLTREELELVVQNFINSYGTKPNMGQVMADLKKNAEGRYDGRMASEVIKAALA